MERWNNAWNGNRGNNNGGQYGGRSDGNRNNNRRPDAPAPVVAEKVPANYVDAAQDYMERNYRKITTSKLRKLLSLVSEVYNVENLRTADQITEASISKLNLMRMRVAYEYGRDTSSYKDMQQLIRGTKLLGYLKWFSTPQPGSRKALIDFYHYMEALVAFHRYYGGRENG